MDTSPVSYPIFVLSGLICWNLFNSSVSHGAESMFKNAQILSKIYFPRLVIPCASILVALFDFLIGLVLFSVFCIVYKQPIDWSAIYYFPAGILLTLLASFGAATLLAALNVKYRDFRYAIPFGLQFLFFATQLIYPIGLIQDTTIKHVLALNPLNGALELFRYPLSGQPIDTTVVLIGIASAIVISVLGLYYFRKTEAYFADIV